MIVYQEFLPSRRLTDVYVVPAVQGNAVAVDVLLCNQSTLRGVDLDVVLTNPGRRGDELLYETGETNPTVLAPSESYFYRNHSLLARETLPLSFKMHAGEILRVKVTTADVSCLVMTEEFVTPDALHAIEERVDVLVEDVLRLQEERESATVSPGVVGSDAERAAARTNTRLRRYPLFDTEEEAVASTAAIESLVISLESATSVESLMLQVSSVSGTADVKAEFRTSWDGSRWDAYDDFTDITSSTLLDRPTQPELMNTYTVNAPINKLIQIRLTGIGANPADTLAAGYLIVREGYA